jgi:hypothetical protein
VGVRQLGFLVWPNVAGLIVEREDTRSLSGLHYPSQSFSRVSRRTRDCIRLTASSCPLDSFARYVPPGIGLTREI